MFTICTLLAVLSIHQSQSACITKQAPFPKIIGGSRAATDIYQIDYHQDSDYLAVVGITYDQGLRGDTLGGVDWYPIIMAYQSTSYIWGKVFTSLFKNSFTGVAFNRLSTRLAVANFQVARYLIILDIVNGNMISANTLSVSKSYYEGVWRNLLLLDDGTIFMGDDFSVIKVSPHSMQATVYT
ncbi:hypothetical protein FGO68_gene2861 [Halteria grandinella]|uniref:Peptidase A1 domain-containing protein n=1 Tax=Halteria grandinella TaxID=5974 RepID=A0A8J8P3Q4_HALGN|nr:hypothetical protein FGO68_gene2861 [Halteria grandinella]